MQRAQDEDEPGEGGVGGDRLEPVVVDVEQDHLRLGGLEDQVSELLHLEARLEGQLELGALVGRGGGKSEKSGTTRDRRKRYVLSVRLETARYQIL